MCVSFCVHNIPSSVVKDHLQGLFQVLDVSGVLVDSYKIVLYSRYDDIFLLFNDVVDTAFRKFSYD